MEKWGATSHFIATAFWFSEFQLTFKLLPHKLFWCQYQRTQMSVCHGRRQSSLFYAILV